MLDSLHQPRIMGILNITDDSFSDGGKCLNPEVAVQHALQMLDAGADIIDIGAESTRPGARSVSATEEWERLHPVISGILDRVPSCYISIDTQKSFVAERAIDLGARMINDVSALEYDPELSILLVERSSIDVVLMHMQGRPETMQINPHYTDVVSEVKQYLIDRLHYAEQQGISAQRIYLDPGIGFGKSLEHNLALLANLDVYHGYQVLLGVSRKSFIGKICDSEPGQRLGGTLAAALMGMLAPVQIIRVHDVYEHFQFAAVLSEINKYRRHD